MALNENPQEGDETHIQDHVELHEFYNKAREFDYAETQSGVEAPTGDTRVDIPGLAVSWDFDGTTPVMIEAYAVLNSNHIDTGGFLIIRDESNTELAQAWYPAPSKTQDSGNYLAITARRRIIPSAGIHTYRASINKVGTATGVFSAVATVNNRPYIRLIGVDVG